MEAESFAGVEVIKCGVSHFGNNHVPLILDNCARNGGMTRRFRITSSRENKKKKKHPGRFVDDRTRINPSLHSATRLHRDKEMVHGGSYGLGRLVKLEGHFKGFRGPMG